MVIDVNGVLKSAALESIARDRVQSTPWTPNSLFSVRVQFPLLDVTGSMPVSRSIPNGVRYTFLLFSLVFLEFCTRMG
jgi:hypothetical protein